MSNTSKLYSAMKRYTDTMLAARDEYLGTMAKYETAKGSQFYEEQKQAASKKRLEATESIKAETIAQVKGLSPEEVAAVTLENGKRFFGIE